MAKFGEGDPKWIVAELGDAGRNVNNWHWTEKDVLAWSKTRIGELVGSLTLLSQSGTTAKTQQPTVEGEAFLTNRKGKLIPSYELQVKIPFEVLGSSNGSKGMGSVEVPYLAEENYGESHEVRVTYDPDRGIEHAVY